MKFQVTNFQHFNEKIVPCVYITLRNQLVSYLCTQLTVNDVSGKDPLVGLEGSEGSFQVKDALERPLRLL